MGIETPYFLKNKGMERGAYLRIGSTTRSASNEMIKSLQLEGENISYDSQNDYRFTQEDIDLSKAETYFLEKNNIKIKKEHFLMFNLLEKKKMNEIIGEDKKRKDRQERQVEKKEIKVGEKVGKKVGEKVDYKLSENQKKIIRLILKNPSISAREISEKIKISLRKTEENIAKLKQKGLLKRFGPAKGGYWEIVSDTW